MELRRYQRTLLASLLIPYATGFGVGGLEPAISSVNDAVAPFLQYHSQMLLSSSASAELIRPADILAAYKESLASNPLYTKMATGATLAIAGDSIAQSREDEPYDIRRAASFAAFDASYRALQHALFPPIVRICDGKFLLSAISSVPFFSKLVSGADQQYFGAVEQTLASQLGVVPFLYYPVFYVLTGCIQQISVSGTVDRAKETFIPLMKRNLLFWIPVQFVQFGFIEEGLQIPFLSVCGLAWTFILSTMAGSTQNYTETHHQDYCATGLEETCEFPDDLLSTEEISSE